VTAAADMLPTPPDPLGVACQQCGVQRGQPCLLPDGSPKPTPHTVRVRQAAKTAARR